MAVAHIYVDADHAAWSKQIPGWHRLIKTWIRAMHRKIIADAAVEMCFLLSSDAKLRRLNREFRGVDKPTNVLSFPALDAAGIRRLRRGKMDGRIFLGDVALAYQTVAREARQQGKPFESHLAHLVVHGALHLLGYDHMTATTARRMEKLECDILHGLGIANPYVIADHRRLD